ncbi:hypothetical protein BpHYR1_025680 [Brachionus plicatilis]|uniref:Uncharacterized protein n=1 Tax=Brachionus plicatilis TaxID=10195 RepID=A0A3M7SH84_BRAPC|nr:hypothetical protein BpHYR1_025680 [Brachionus plicatilis]
MFISSQNLLIYIGCLSMILKEIVSIIVSILLNTHLICLPLSTDYIFFWFYCNFRLKISKLCKNSAIYCIFRKMLDVQATLLSPKIYVCKKSAMCLHIKGVWIAGMCINTTEFT